MNLACVTLLGFNLTKATAHAKVMNLTSNFASLIFFFIGGHVIWTVGLVMMAGSLIGANLGAKMVMAKGKQLIRPMVVIMSFIMTIKMAYDQGWFHFLTIDYDRFSKKNYVLRHEQAMNRIFHGHICTQKLGYLAWYFVLLLLAFVPFRLRDKMAEKLARALTKKIGKPRIRAEINLNSVSRLDG